MSEFVLVVIGAGPRGTGLLERIAANAHELLPPDRALTIHLVDPHPPGGGRVWRQRQSALLRMNSMAEDVTMFTDERSTLAGPVSPGPSLAEWAASAPEARHHPDDAVRAELRTLAPTDFPTRRAQSAYLGWVHDRARAELPPWVTVHEHLVAAVELGEWNGRQTVRLADRRVLHADLVVLALGHLDAVPEPGQERLAAFASRHGLRYLPPDYTADSDLSVLRPGEDVVLRGFGLAFVDAVVLLTEGRGGHYTEAADGELVYHPSGREPVLHVGSRRGVPYHAKTGYRLQGPVPPLPRFFTAAAVDRLLDGAQELDFRADVWPLLAKEIGWGYYHELFHGHPDRTALDWDTFADAYARLDWYGAGMAALVAAAVPAPEDRLDFEALDRPLAGRSFASAAEFTEQLTAYVRADLARRGDPQFSADLGAFYALLSVYTQLPRLAASGRLRPDSLRRDVDGWWQGFFSFLASGPPPFRLRELLALSRAGVLRFLGPELRVSADEESGRFVASSPAVAGHVVAATALVEARLPRPTLANTASPLLSSLRDRGEVTEDHATGLIAVRQDDGALLLPDGTVHPQRLALGAPTNTRAVAAFARPRTDSPAFRQNDTVARAILHRAAAPVSAQPVTASPSPAATV
ncbi:FAD/NAD(P)-binding protein [Streptacidiphilus monticola]|uniref:FAD/NAD(P)-binding protein n=1 Tax=Streptacidiphilus monticola TaxID=2161674 RepID=A0ABW1GBN4_9ACTN